MPDWERLPTETLHDNDDKSTSGQAMGTKLLETKSDQDLSPQTKALQLRDQLTKDEGLESGMARPDISPPGIDRLRMQTDREATEQHAWHSSAIEPVQIQEKQPASDKFPATLISNTSSTAKTTQCAKCALYEEDQEIELLESDQPCPRCASFTAPIVVAANPPSYAAVLKKMGLKRRFGRIDGNLGLLDSDTDSIATRIQCSKCELYEEDKDIALVEAGQPCQRCESFTNSVDNAADGQLLDHVASRQAILDDWSWVR